MAAENCRDCEQLEEDLSDARGSYRPDTVTVTACSADVCPRLCALAERVTELEGALRRILDLRTRDNPVCGCGECSQCVARAALASGAESPAESAPAGRVSRLETALAALLDAAERQAAGFPIEAERWFAVRDAARAMLPEKEAPRG